MLEFLSSLLVQKPGNILLVAAVWVALWALLRWTSLGAGRHPGALLVPVAGWALYAAWEYLVLVRTPDADMRVDLLAIWPVLFIVSVWFAIKALRAG